MTEEIKATKTALESAPEDHETINGTPVELRHLDEDQLSILKGIIAQAKKYKLTNKPLDTVHDVQEAFVVDENTTLRPAFSVTKNGSSHIDWVVEFIDGENDRLGLLVKPLVLLDAGVSEYWAVDSKKKKIYLYDFSRGKLFPNVIDSPRRIKVEMYPNLYVSYSELFKK